MCKRSFGNLLTRKDFAPSQKSDLKLNFLD
jgi:hypothetical protein